MMVMANANAQAAKVRGMCNLYHVSSKQEIERHFRLIVAAGTALPEGTGVAVGPFGQGVMIRANAAGERQAVAGQWGMIAPHALQPRPASRAILTNNARIESVAERPTYRDAWALGRRCLIPAQSYQEPNWETGRNIWWQLRRADGAPWALAGIWSEWVNPNTGELLPNYSMLTMNCDGHPLLSRLHKPDPRLPADAQDKRSAIPIAAEHWDAWLRAPLTEAQALLRLPPADLFDPAVTQVTDELLARLRRDPGPTQGSLI
ncbi:SOS response-associated peptidase [Paucibacter sp. TC2R-5]|uniref:SOS response-associated peptidase n=1 Tax=Paucibacter sp. TC2R-5 TaxID=2893555 RepID=UPI0021E4DFC0|nr:SOS response-associated peptidase [Paucibacter sp. TC2R-5]MCV2358410.1 SOS response-associated peptidase [Paucibacter sp. TC2R-5]